VGFVMLTVIMQISCSKNKGSGVSSGSGEMTATIDNVKYILNINTITQTVQHDTTSITIEGLTIDSTKSIGLYFKEIIGFGTKTYYCGLMSDSSGGYLQTVYYNLGSDSVYVCDGISSKGSVSIVSFTNGTIEGKFNFNAVYSRDSSKIVTVVGDFNCSINDFLNGTDLPIGLGKLYAQANDVNNYFTVIAGKTTHGNEYDLIVNGNLNQQSISIDFQNFTPQINVTYKVGNFDSSMVAGVRMVYIKNDSVSYVADGTKGSSGTVKLAKLTGSNIQGVFNFTGTNPNDINSKISVTNGMFNAKLTNY
jgi:hypothetical protein